MKKFMSLLMAIVMVFTLATPVKAADYTITINNEKDGHTYEVYQIFTGDLDSSENVLSNVKWGKDVTNAAALGDAGSIAKRLSNDYTGDDKLTVDALLELVKLTDKPTTDSEKPYQFTGLAAGYYLVKDQDGSLAGDHDAYTKYIVQVVDDVEMEPKNAYPTVDKQVWDELEDGEINEEGERVNWGETADHDINETFEFKLIATLPSDVDFAAYDKYKVVFTDTMSEGITFENIVSVKVDGETIPAGQNGYICSVTEGEEKVGGTWTLTIENIKVQGVDLTDGAIVEVIYEAHLNEAAKINNDKENKNTVYLEYSNNPNVGGEDELGKTPEDHVWVFTYVVDGTKVDGAKKDGDKYTKPLENAEFVFYKGEGTNKEYVVLGQDNKVDGWVKDKSQATVIKTPKNGTFTIIGLDAGTYYLEETKAPDGYNLLTEPKVVTITATHQETTTTNAETLNGTSIPSVNVTVENFAGATLPETGGMGTTLFYVFGSLLAIGAIVLLVTKKRMNEE